MKWQSMKTAPRDGRLVWVTVDWSGARHTMEAYCQCDMHAWICDGEFVPDSRVLAWTPIPTPYTGTLEELDAEGGDA